MVSDGCSVPVTSMHVVIAALTMLACGAIAVANQPVVAASNWKVMVSLLASSLHQFNL